MTIVVKKPYNRFVLVIWDPNSLLAAVCILAYTPKKCPFPYSTKSPKMPFRISILERIFMSQLIPDPNFLPPTLDIVFKRLFSAKENERLLISLLTAVLVPESPLRRWRF